MTRPVLILGAEARVVVAIARSLHRRGIPVDVAALSEDVRLRSRAIRNFVHLPSYRHAPHEFGEALFELIRAEQFDMLIPCSDAALTVVTRHYWQLCSLLHVGCPPPYIVKRVLDKISTLEVAQRCGVPIPPTYLVSNVSALEDFRSTLRFPMIAKPRGKMDIGTHTFKVRYFQTFEELKDAFLADAHIGVRTILQEYCSGEGVGIAALMHNGEPVAMFQHRRLKELPSTGGVSVSATSEALDPTLANHALRLLRNLEWEGIAMVEFRDDPANGTAVLMEVNGRYWGSLALALHAGLDLPLYEWQLAHGEKPYVPPHYRAGVRVRWMAGDVRRLHGLLAESMNDGHVHPSRYRELAGFVTDFRPTTRGMVWSVRDPLPAISELSGAVKDLAVAAFKAIIKRLLPPGLLVDVRSRLLRTIKLWRIHLRRIPAGARSVLFVCHGNIIRSPMAAALLGQCLSDQERHAVSIASAGLHANPARGADARALIVAREFGVSLDDHRCRPLTQQMVQRSDAIIVMDCSNEAMLLGRYPEARHKVFLLGAMGDRVWSHPIEITDPYEGDITDIRRCYEILQSRIHTLTRLLFPPSQDKGRAVG